MEQIKGEVLFDTPVTFIVSNNYTRSLFVDFQSTYKCKISWFSVKDSRFKLCWFTQICVSTFGTFDALDFTCRTAR
jgi:hypothetical protein